MSTEINLEELYNNSVKILTDLIGFRTISGEDNSALINYCEDYLRKLGATSLKTFDKEKKRGKSFCYFKSKKNKWY
jgi:acetylornithine deacetylase